MRENRFRKENIWTSEARTTVLIGFVLRLVMVLFILYVASNYWDIFYIEDDKKYEGLAAVYRANARGIWDLELFDVITAGYAAKFWPLVMCVMTKLFGTVYVGRYINVVLSTICIALTYDLCYEISGNQKTALTAARWFAFLPFSVLVSCFPVKDIFIMMCAMYAFYIFVRVQNSRKVSAFQYLLLAVLLVCIYFARGAVTELLLMYFLVYYLQKLYRRKKYFAALVLLIGALVVYLAFRSVIFASFETKIEGAAEGVGEAAGLNVVRVTGVLDIYKLPLAYAFAMLQPMQHTLFTIVEDTRPWSIVMAYANITMYPVAIGAWLYMFVKKHNLFFWLSSFAMFSAVFILSMGISRHYLFLFPMHMINFALYMEETHPNFKNRRTLVILGTFALLVLVVCYSLVKVL